MTALDDAGNRMGKTVAAQLAVLRPELQAEWRELPRSVILEHVEATLPARIDAELGPALHEWLRHPIAAFDDEALRRSTLEVAHLVAARAGLIEALERGGYRARLYELAARHHGYVSVDMAHAVGVPAVEVRKIASRGGLDNIARGLYRATGVDGGERAPFAEAVLRVGESAHLLGDAVLAFHNLAFVNPARIKVGIDRRVRRELPPHIEVIHTSIPDEDVTEYDGVRSTTVERALRDSIGAVMPERLVEAAHQAIDEGLIRRRAAAPLLSAIGASA